MLSHHEIEDHIARIDTAVTALDRGDGDLTGCTEVDALLEALREQYRQQPDTLADKVGQLADLRRRFDAWLAARVPQAVDRFHAVIKQIHRAECEKQFWRRFLVLQAEAGQTERINGAQAVVRVRSIRSRKLPPSQSEDRARLEALIREAGRWEQASQLARRKLEQCLAQDQFTPPTAQAIDQLCPVTITHQVSSYDADRPPRPGPPSA